jgi:Protein of unknown function (DUF2934)
MNRTHPDYARVELLAYWLWQQRGSPIGSPLDDWFQAEHMLGINPSATVPPPLFSLRIEDEHADREKVI